MNNDVKPNFYLPSEIFIEQDITEKIPEIISRFGTRAVIITNSVDFEIYHEKIQSISTQLKRSDIGCIIYDELPAYPNTEDIDIAAAFIKKSNCDLIIGFGGVESIHSAKALSILVPNYIFCHDLFQYPYITNKPLKIITIPAHPIFGFEITPMFYLDEIHELTKKIYYNNILYPAATIIDPSLSISISEEKAMTTMIGSLAMATESVISKENNDVINTFALKSIDLIFRNLHNVYNEIDNVSPRNYLSLASVMSGIAFSTSKLSVSLAIALALSARTEITVENAMSIIIPHIMEFNLTSSPGKYVQMSKVMGQDVKEITVIEAAIKAVEAIRKLESDINIPTRLSNYEISKSQFKEIAEIAISYPFVTNTPRPLNTNEIETILIAAY